MNAALNAVVAGARAARVRAAIALIACVPGYEADAQALARLLETERIRYVPVLADRAHAGLTGIITLGPEPFAQGATLAGLAETLVHEAYHGRQNPLLKSVSFWAGVFTRTDTMLRYERPAYEYALRFLTRLAEVVPERADEAGEESEAVRAGFGGDYGAVLDLSVAAPPR